MGYIKKEKMKNKKETKEKRSNLVRDKLALMRKSIYLMLILFGMIGIMYVVLVYALPSITNLTLSSTNSLTNDTNTNLSITYTADATTTKNITNWYVNGQSIAVLNMPFEGGSNATFTKDYSGFSNNGTVVGATWNSTGGYDGKGAYGFDGVSGYINLSNSGNFNIVGNKTIIAWIKTTSPAYSRIFTRMASSSPYYGYQLILWNDGKIAYGTDGNWIQSNSAWNNGLWHQVAVVVRDTNITFYGDGSLDGSKTMGLASSYSNNAYIGVWVTSFFNGFIDDVQIYNRSLSAQEIRNLYNNRTDLIDAQETTLGENWSACVVPNDGTSDGAQVCSNNLTILNGASTISLVSPTDANMSYLSRGNILINVTASDMDGLANITINLYNSTSLVNSSFKTTSPYYVNITGLLDGIYWFNSTVTDLVNAFTSSATYKVILDTIYPAINFTGQTSSSGTYQSGTSIPVNISSSDTNGHYAVVDFDNSLVGWWRMEQGNGTFFKDDSGRCYDNETQVLTLREVDCGEVDCGFDGVVCEDSNGVDNSVISGSDDVDRVTGNVINNNGEINYKEENNNNYNELDNNEKEKEAFDVASKVQHIYTDYNYSYDYNYINLSADNNSADGAPVAQGLQHRIDTSGLHRHPGSSPGWGASATSVNDIKCYVKEWKYFKDLGENDVYMTLNQTNGNVEMQKASARLTYDYNGDMYKITLDDGSVMKVSEKHRVYASDAFSKNSFSSSVVNTLTSDCSLKCLSLDQIGMRNLRANARYCLSSGSDINAFARFNCCGETFFSKLTNLENISFILSNLSSETFNNLQSSPECSSSSSKIYSCENNSRECSCANLLVNESFFNKENAMLASITNFIYCSPDSSANLLLTNLPSLKQSSSDRVLSLVNSSSSSNNFAFSSCLRTSSLASSDQFTQANSFISDLTSLGIENITDAIYILPPCSNSFSFFNCSIFNTIILLNTSDHLISGCLSIIFLDSSGTDNVSVVILTPYSYVDEHKSVGIYKPFALGDLSNFSLQPITDVYSDVNNGKDVYFLNGDNKEVRVKSIEKVPYSGKIYDVDVPDDIVLVRRLRDVNNRDDYVNGINGGRVNSEGNGGLGDNNAGRVDGQVTEISGSLDDGDFRDFQGNGSSNDKLTKEGVRVNDDKKGIEGGRFRN